MRYFGLPQSLFAAMFALGCSAVEREAPTSSIEPDRAEPTDAEPIAPLPMEVDIDEPVARLGEELFTSPVLSDDNRVACSGCHGMDHGYADSNAFSELPGRQRTSTNTTSLFNVRSFYKLTWDGKFDSLEAHLDAAIRDPRMMGTRWGRVLTRLNGAPWWVARFRAVFKDGVNLANLRRALVEYQRSLVTPNAPFDRWLRGDAEALTPEATHGYALFKDYGCISCHQGMAVGANMLQRFGVMRDYFAGRENLREADLGRYNVTHREEDRHVFRVPSLRNVALTAPYFHDGSALTLDAAVTVMGDYQLGRQLPTEDVSAIVAFLESLTGEFRGKL